MLATYLNSEVGNSGVITAFPRLDLPEEPFQPEPEGHKRRRFRTIWISDIHLGTRGCNAQMLIDFLDHTDSETMYLVGDIIDGWRLKKKFYWPAAHNDIVRRILKRAKRGTRIVYIPGNHDEMFRQFTGLSFGGVEIRRAAFHETADGRRLMVLHGDEFDAVMLAHRWLAVVGDALYTLMMGLNHWVNAGRRWLGLPYWSLSKMAKHKVKNAVEFISRYEEIVARAAAQRKVDGVVCGHIHTAEIREFDGIEYYNDGDWVEGCTALVEHFDGRMEILHWADEIEKRNLEATPQQFPHVAVAALSAMRIAIITDAWTPQVNGVVRTLTTICEQLRGRGHDVLVISPDIFPSVPCPTYPEIRLAMPGQSWISRAMADFSPDAVHIATEGPLGWAARRWCVSHNHPFTTAYHTQFPQYLSRRTGLPAGLFWPFMRHFHGRSSGIMVSTETIRQELRAQGLHNLRSWSRGVDLSCFSPDVAPPDLFFGLTRPIQLYVGRVAVEKNVEAFLSSNHPGSKVVVGDGPALSQLSARFPNAIFLGQQKGRKLAACYAGADVLVFPSRTDTFGLVMIEALACGTPVAAYPVPGPMDVLNESCGAMRERLDDAIAAALKLDRVDCLNHGCSFSWDASTDQFLAALAPASALPVTKQLAAIV